MLASKNVNGELRNGKWWRKLEQLHYIKHEARQFFNLMI